MSITGLEKNNCQLQDYDERNISITTNGKSQEIPDPLCRAAIVVGPPKEGIQKKPSVNTPFKEKFYSYQRWSIVLRMHI